MAVLHYDHCLVVNCLNVWRSRTQDRLKDLHSWVCGFVFTFHLAADLMQYQLHFMSHDFSNQKIVYVMFYLYLSVSRSSPEKQEILKYYYVLAARYLHHKF